MTTQEEQQPKKESMFFSKHFLFGSAFGAIIAILIGSGYFLIKKGPVADPCVALLDNTDQIRRLTSRDGQTYQEVIMKKIIQDKFDREVKCDPKNTIGIRGGFIHRCALVAIINSLDALQQTVEYGFGIDDQNRTVLLLQGGKTNPFYSTDQTYPQYFRYPLTIYTGNSMDCFCPLHCGTLTTP